MKNWLIACVLIVCAGCSAADPAEGPDKTETPNYRNTQSRSAKRGVSFSFKTEEEVSQLAPGICWSYNWGPDVPTPQIAAALDRNEIVFCPMAWNGRYDAARIRAWKAAHPQSAFLLAFNEPNLNDQARMTPQEAAAEWPQLKALADELGMKLIAPAMNYGTLNGYGDPIVWLDEFFSLVPIDDVAGLAIHCYMGSPAALKSYVQRFYKYGKPIWMTEFCAWEKNITSLESQRRYLAQVLGYMEADDHVAAYAWFIPRGGGTVNTYPYNPLLTNDNPAALTELGTLYCNYTSMDRTLRFLPGEAIPAEHFVACNASSSASSEEWVAFPDVRPATDPGGILELYELFFNQWVEYLVRVSDTAEGSLSIRYSAPVDTQVEITCGAVTRLVTLPQTGNGIWTTGSYPLAPAAGDHTLRLKIVSGVASLNWLSIR